MEGRRGINVIFSKSPYHRLDMPYLFVKNPAPSFIAARVIRETLDAPCRCERTGGRNYLYGTGLCVVGLVPV